MHGYCLTSDEVEKKVVTLQLHFKRITPTSSTNLSISLPVEKNMNQAPRSGFFGDFSNSESFLCWLVLRWPVISTDAFAHKCYYFGCNSQRSRFLTSLEIQMGSSPQNLFLQKIYAFLREVDFPPSPGDIPGTRTIIICGAFC